MTTAGQKSEQDHCLFTINCFSDVCHNRTSLMLLNIFKSKIHRVKVTQAELNYVGSITIDADLMDAADLLEGEKVQIVNLNNGERLETYTIRGERGTGTICMNGPAARKVQVDDTVIIISYAHMTAEEAKAYEPVIVFPDENNRLPKVPARPQAVEI